MVKPIIPRFPILPSPSLVGAVLMHCWHQCDSRHPGPRASLPMSIRWLHCRIDAGRVRAREVGCACSLPNIASARLARARPAMRYACCHLLLLGHPRESGESKHNPKPLNPLSAQLSVWPRVLSVHRSAHWRTRACVMAPRAFQSFSTIASWVMMPGLYLCVICRNRH
jgi:hypothetical protein